MKSFGEDGKLVNTDAANKLAFIDGDDDEELKDIEGEIKHGEEANLVKIVMSNLVEKYQSDAQVLKQAKSILKKSEKVPAETVQQVSDAYRRLKEQDYSAVLEQLYPSKMDQV